MPATLRGLPGSTRSNAEASSLPTVFVVESDLSVRLSLVWLLESLGVEVRAFTSTREFLERFDGSSGCLVVDIGLRGVDPLLRFAREVQRRRPGLPLVAMSADPFIAPEDVRHAGVLAFLHKPFASDTLLRCLRDACACAEDPPSGALPN